MMRISLAPSAVIELEDGAVGIVAITATIPGKKRQINLTLDANLINLIEAKDALRASGTRCLSSST